jgi:hypothetical protein
MPRPVAWCDEGATSLREDTGQVLRVRSEPFPDLEDTMHETGASPHQPKG